MKKTIAISLLLTLCSSAYAQGNLMRLAEGPNSVPDIPVLSTSTSGNIGSETNVESPDTDTPSQETPVEDREWQILATFGKSNANSVDDVVMGKNLNSRDEILGAGFTFDPSPEKLNYISSPDRNNWINFYYSGNSPAGLNFTVPQGMEQVRVYYGTSFYSNDRQHIVELKHNGVTIDSVTEGSGLQSSLFTFDVNEGDTVTLYEQWSVMAVNTIWVR